MVEVARQKPLPDESVYDADSIQVLKGQLRVSVNGKSHDLPTGTLFTLGHFIRHDVEAKGDSAFLLTISWPTAEELAAMKHRGYGT